MRDSVDGGIDGIGPQMNVFAHPSAVRHCGPESPRPEFDDSAAVSFVMAEKLPSRLGAVQ